MFIENWLAALLFAVFAIFAILPSVGWFFENLRLEKAEEQNKKLLQDRADLRIENLHLKSLVNFYRANNEEQK